MPRYHTRFQVRLQAQQSQKAQQSSLQEEVAHITMLILESEKHRGYLSKIGIAAELLEYIVDHPTVMKSEQFRIAMKNKIQEFNSDPNVNACKRLQTVMGVLEKI